MADDTKARDADNQADDEGADADEAGEPADDPRLRRGQNEAVVSPNPRSFLNADEAARHAADAAAAGESGPKYDPNTGQRLRD